ncbi:MAG: helix-turn-helix domain-containing protein, partial [Actinophytocola sp.]|nr:helix-turn-helix domain-containing protein [Actinophytocola sp.]
QYPIESVDNALRVLLLLGEQPKLRLTDVSRYLGVASSTAHRLLAMLVYRDFAEQAPDRRYGPGKVLRPAETSEAPVALLRRVALPHLQRLVDRTHESANLVVLAGTEVHFIASVESDQILRVGDRAGRSLPAHLASGGKAILAALPADAVEELYQDTDVDLARLRRELRLVRRRGFAINNQLTETGLTAVGMRVDHPAGTPVAAVSIALPTARFDRDRLPAWASALSEAVTAIEADLAVEA